MGYSLGMELTGLVKGLNTGRREDSRTVLTVLVLALGKRGHPLRCNRLEKRSGLRKIIKVSVFTKWSLRYSLDTGEVMELLADYEFGVSGRGQD